MMWPTDIQIELLQEIEKPFVCFCVLRAGKTREYYAVVGGHYAANMSAVPRIAIARFRPPAGNSSS